MEFSDLSWVGNITGLKNGDIEVTWADGMDGVNGMLISYPQNIQDQILPMSIKYKKYPIE